jgi:asparagine synthase (glutamine-hydrolysing)
VSGIAGVFHRDGRAAGADATARLAAALAHRGPDGCQVHLAQSVALIHLSFATTPEAKGERQPLANPERTLWITFDGRLDNRRDLAGALGDREDVLPLSDAALVLRAYARWQEAAVARLAGDFAFALWDAGRGVLVCARDPLGIRPFYYHADRDTFVLASEPRALLIGARFRVTPNEGFIGECLAAEPVHVTETLFDGVLRLPAAHVLVVGRDTLRMSRYWDPNPAQIVCRDDGEYGERLREVLDRAVAARLRSTGPVGAHLSGGLDSSSVVCTAAALLDRAGRSAPTVETFALRFPGKPYDEGPYIQAVSERCGLPLTAVEPPESDEPALMASLDRSWDLPDYPTGDAAMRWLFARARERQVRVVLTGVGGDQWLAGSSFYYADLIRRGRLIALTRLLAAAQPDSELAWTPFQVIRSGIFPLVPARARRLARRVLGWSAVPSWIHAGFARRIGLGDRLRAPALVRGSGGYAGSALRRLLGSGWEALTNELIERAAAWHGIEYRHPFYDQRLVEYALALPEEQRQRGAHTKWVLRTAMRGQLPELVRLRTSKADLSDVYLRALQALGGEGAFARMAIAEAGWIDGTRVRAMYRDAAAQAARGDEAYASHMIPLWMVLAVERWYQAFSSGAWTEPPVAPAPDPGP